MNKIGAANIIKLNFVIKCVFIASMMIIGCTEKEVDASDELCEESIQDFYIINEEPLPNGKQTSSQVFRAIRKDNSKSVIIKGVRPTIEKGFTHEYKILKSLIHENIVKLEDKMYKSRDSDLYFFVMEECEVIDFDRYINARMCKTDAVKMCRDILLGIHAVHQTGIIHGNINKNSIVLKDENFKLIGFGLAIENVGQPESFLNKNYELELLHCVPEIKEQNLYTSAIDIYLYGLFLNLLKKVVPKPPLLFHHQFDETFYLNLSSLIKKYLEVDVKKRIIADEALNEPFFDVFKPKIQSFKSFYDFETKLINDTLSKKNNELVFSDGKITIKMIEENENINIFINGKEKKPYLLTNKELKAVDFILKKLLEHQNEKKLRESLLLNEAKLAKRKCFLTKKMTRTQIESILDNEKCVEVNSNIKAREHQFNSKINGAEPKFLKDEIFKGVNDFNDSVLDVLNVVQEKIEILIDGIRNLEQKIDSLNDSKVSTKSLGREKII